MRTIHETSQFRRDHKKLKKQRKDLEKLKEVVLLLVSGRPLESRYRDHALIGPWQGSRDCYIEPDFRTFQFFSAFPFPATRSNFFGFSFSRFFAFFCGKIVS